MTDYYSTSRDGVKWTPYKGTACMSRLGGHINAGDNHLKVSPEDYIKKRSLTVKQMHQWFDIMYQCGFEHHTDQLPTLTQMKNQKDIYFDFEGTNNGLWMGWQSCIRMLDEDGESMKKMLKWVEDGDCTPQEGFIWLQLVASNYNHSMHPSNMKVKHIRAIGKLPFTLDKHTPNITQAKGQNALALSRNIRSVGGEALVMQELNRYGGDITQMKQIKEMMTWDEK